MSKNKIRERREELGLSQIKLGLLSGVHNGAISDFELGKRLPWPRARKALAQALKVTEAELFGSDDSH